MLSSTPSRQPGEDFRRKVAAHWGVTYAQLEALALGEEPPSASEPSSGRTDAMPPNLTASSADYVWMHELPTELRLIVLEQARQHYAFTLVDLPREEWRRILTGLEREALALVAHRAQTDTSDEPARAARKRQPRN
ncbi:MAG: hypothetical protein KF850_33850 [Labilithrix sp.]|nr:hypothetical protein [Labilithrix sp.]